MARIDTRSLSCNFNRPALVPWTQHIISEEVVSTSTSYIGHIQCKSLHMPLAALWVEPQLRMYSQAQIVSEEIILCMCPESPDCLHFTSIWPLCSHHCMVYPCHCWRKLWIGAKIAGNIRNVDWKWNFSFLSDTYIIDCIEVWMVNLICSNYSMSPYNNSFTTLIRSPKTSHQICFITSIILRNI